MKEREILPHRRYALSHQACGMKSVLALAGLLTWPRCRRMVCVLQGRGFDISISTPSSYLRMACTLRHPGQAWGCVDVTAGTYLAAVLRLVGTPLCVELLSLTSELRSLCSESKGMSWGPCLLSQALSGFSCPATRVGPLLLLLMMRRLQLLAYYRRFTNRSVCECKASHSLG